MHRSRFTPVFSAVLVLAALLAAPSATHAEERPWSPQLGYVLTTGSVRSQLKASLRLTASQDGRLRAIGYELAEAQAKVQRRSDAVVMSDSLSPEEKRALIAASGYNGSLQDAEASAVASAAAVVGITPDRLAAAVDTLWQQDAATHRLETELTALGVTPQAVVGSFHVYATRFYDEYADTFGVALPDKYVKFANKGLSRPAGYPDGLYAVSLYWDGVHHGRDNKLDQTISTPHSVASAKVVDVGPWNTDDNWWNSYTDAQRPRRINSSGISYHDTATGGGGKDFLVGKPHLALGLPESQAAYFNYYGRPGKIPAHSTTWENYWDKPRGYGGQWSGADQFGRQVTQPAAIDLTPPCYAALGLTDNEWIDVIPLWEARLGQTGSLTLSKKPAFTAQDAVVSFAVKNLGSLTATWERAALWPVGSSVKENPADFGSFTLAPGASKTFTFTKRIGDAGPHVWTPWTRRAGVWTQLSTATVSFTTVERTVDRIEGADRYATAVGASAAAFPATASSVVIATGRDFPDALAGAPLARAENGPLLLTERDELPDVVRAEIVRLHPSRAIILGGPSSVASAVASEIATLVGGAQNVRRIRGQDRYDTARLIAEDLAARPGSPALHGTAIVATGKSFPDALAGSVLAAAKGWPVLLVEPSRLPTYTAAALKSLGTTSTVVLGGTGSVGDGVYGKLPSPRRIAGSDRYETAALLADETGKASGWGWAWTGLATGESFPDALAGGCLAAANHGVLLLTPPEALSPYSRDRLTDHRTVTATLRAFGSTRSLPGPVLDAAAEALR